MEEMWSVMNDTGHQLLPVGLGHIEVPSPILTKQQNFTSLWVMGTYFNKFNDIRYQVS